MRTSVKRAVMAFAVMFAASELNMGATIDLPRMGGFFSSSAEAAVVVRRPVARPVGVGGVAVRTTRRVIRRGAYIAAVPVGCAYGTYYGYSLYYCGGTYYQKSGGGYVVVYF